MDLWRSTNTRKEAILQRLYLLYCDSMIHLQLNPKAIEERPVERA